MKYFPINLNISGRKCTVVGGGKVAARKTRALLDCGGSVTVISPELTKDFKKMLDDQIINWQQREYMPGDLAGSFVVVAATDETLVQKEVYREAEDNGQLVNVADVPELCNFILPATVKRNDLTISVSTAGKSPALARKIRQDLESIIGQEYGQLADIMGLLRKVVLKDSRPHEENKVVFDNLLHDDFVDWIRESNWFKVEKHLTDILGKDIDQGLLKAINSILDRA